MASPRFFFEGFLKEDQTEKVLRKQLNFCDDPNREETPLPDSHLDDKLAKNTNESLNKGSVPTS